MKFPQLKTIDDVLPALKGHDEFFVAERPFGTVINYQVALPDSFDDPVRRECRGIIFYPDGRIMSRPFHKFFNYGEKPHEDAVVDFSEAELLEKLDGSMIRPIWEGDQFRLGTKMGYTEVGDQAQAWLEAGNGPTYSSFIRAARANNLTPIFEWCSPQNRIVIPHVKDELILLAIRDNIDGHYTSRDAIEYINQSYNIPIVQSFGQRALEHVLEEAKERKDFEGWVATFPSGHRVKVKVDWYVDLHKAKECIAREKYVIDAILDEFIDDLKAKLQDQDRVAVETFDESFTEGLWAMVHEVNEEWIATMKYKQEDTDMLLQTMEPDAARREAKKRFALNSQSMPHWKRSILFALWDGKTKSPYEGVINALRQMTRTQSDIDKNRSVWGGAKYVYGGVSIDA